MLINIHEEQVREENPILYSHKTQLNIKHVVVIL